MKWVDSIRWPDGGTLRLHASGAVYHDSIYGSRSRIGFCVDHPDQGSVVVLPIMRVRSQ